MRTFNISLPDEMVEALETIFSPEEVPLIVNQAVLREIEDWCHRHGIDSLNYCTTETCDVNQSKEDDANAQEWTR